MLSHENLNRISMATGLSYLQEQKTNFKNIIKYFGKSNITVEL